MLGGEKKKKKGGKEKTDFYIFMGFKPGGNPINIHADLTDVQKGSCVKKLQFVDRSNVLEVGKFTQKISIAPAV